MERGTSDNDTTECNKAAHTAITEERNKREREREIQRKECRVPGRETERKGLRQKVGKRWNERREEQRRGGGMERVGERGGSERK